MKPQLNTIPWENLTHAYGSAEDIPEILELLYDETDIALRKEAIKELWGNIYHQGTVYEATAYAVPFLIDLLQQENIPDKKEIFDLLTAIYDGNYRKPVILDARTEILKHKDFLSDFLQKLDKKTQDEYIRYQDDFSLLQLLLQGIHHSQKSNHF